MTEYKLYAVIGLQILILILLIIIMFKEYKHVKKMKAEIKRLDKKIKTFGCVGE